MAGRTVVSTLTLVLAVLMCPAHSAAQLTTTTTNITTNTVGTTPTVTTTTSPVTEWDVSTISNSGIDAQPGAVSVDKNNGRKAGIWFVTRFGDFRVIRLQPYVSARAGYATWTSWSLDTSGLTTGGIKRVKAADDGGSVFVRTLVSLQQIDTNHCWTSSNRIYCNDTEYLDGNTPCATAAPPPPACSGVSDLSLDNHGNIYSAVTPVVNTSVDPTSPNYVADPSHSYIERLVPSPGGAYARVTIWPVGGGAGNCDDSGANSPCIAGIDVHPSNAQLIYYSEPDASSNSIAELNTATNMVRRWSLTNAFADSSGSPVAFGPRQLHIDEDAIVWVVTASGHVVSLDPKKNILSLHQMPDGASADPFGVAPDGGFVGYTASDTNKVGLLIPAGQAVYVCPSTAPAAPTGLTVPTHTYYSVVSTGQSSALGKSVFTTITRKSDGTFIEASIDSNTANGESTLPLGIMQHPGKAVGTFFYAVGAALAADNTTVVNRVGLARLPRAGFYAHHDREDHDYRDDGSNQDDEAHDGVAPQYESNDGEAHQTREDAQTSGGQSLQYTLTANPNTAVLIAATQADNPITPVSIQIIDPNGLTLAAPAATPGAALATLVPTYPGVYTVVVSNAGVSSTMLHTQLVTKSPLALF
jgi:hypothetical protein